MKRYAVFFLCIVFLLTGCSASVKEVYGTWYVDTGDTRNIIQFYEYDTTDNAFIWAVYDIAADQRTSVESGTYELKDGTITLTYTGGAVVTLNYEINGDTLTLVMDGSAMDFQLYELPDTTV